MMARLSVLLVAVMAFTIVSAQEIPPTPSPAFEVASVKRNVSGRRGGSIRVSPAGGEVNYTNMPLRVLIHDAYQLDAASERYTLILGRYAGIIGNAADGPQPDVPRFDVRAKPAANSPSADRHAMMRALLEDRFKLRVHRETRQVAVYALTVVREGRFGPNLSPSKFDCTAFAAQRRAASTVEEPVDASGKSWCRYPIDHTRPGVENKMRMAGPIRLMIDRTQPFLEQPLVDATGVSGNVEWELTFSWGPNAPVDVPDLFAALEEQLGLRLVSRQAPIEVLVIDSVEMPTSD